MAPLPLTTSSKLTLLGPFTAGCSHSPDQTGQRLAEIDGARPPAWRPDARLVYVLPNEGRVERIADVS
jgi:hypothetical protein